MNSENKDGPESGDRLVVICCICNKIQDDTGEWATRTGSCPQNSGIVYSHGMCPDCVQSQYGNELWYKQYEKDSAR